MRILMLGWEFPPFISGGLGTACHGLTRALTRLETQILFVLPTVAPVEGSVRVGHAARPVARRVRKPEGFKALKFLPVPSAITSPYAAVDWREQAARSLAPNETEPPAQSDEPGAEEPTMRILGAGALGGYEGNLIRRIGEYADRCLQMTRGETFDVIHAHDWVTFPAGLAIASRTGRPLVVHVHSTEFDRTGEHVNQPVYDVERAGVHGASAVVAVSNLTRNILVDRYGVDPQKVRVVYNGIENNRAAAPARRAGNRQKVVLFLGRITMQKGSEFFIRAAQRVLQKMDNVQFVVAGWGDLGPRAIETVMKMGLARKVRFTGFLRGREVERAYRMADVYVMPSVSEPFGLTALEAIRHGVPVVLSRNSGVAEVLPRGALKCDFWDVDEIANKIVSILNRPELADSLRRDGAAEIRVLSWESAARKCVQVYNDMIESSGRALAG